MKNFPNQQHPENTHHYNPQPKNLANKIKTCNP